jgi:Ras-related protein Rab-8A
MHYDSISIEEEYYDLKIRLMLIGDSNVGKTSIIKRYCNNQFSPSYISTVGIDFETKYLRLNGKIINLQIWDTAGQERYKVLAKNYYKNSDGFIIVYDITDKKVLIT